MPSTIPVGKHGKKGRVTILSTNYRITKWDGDDQTESVEITSTEDGGFQTLDPDGGIEKMNGSITFLAVPGQAAPTKGLHDLILYEGGTDATDAYCFKAFVSGIKHANQVNTKDPITWEASYESSGKIVRNSATIDNPYGH